MKKKKKNFILLPITTRAVSCSKSYINNYDMCEVAESWTNFTYKMLNGAYITMLDFIGDDKFAVVSKSDFQRSWQKLIRFFQVKD